MSVIRMQRHFRVPSKVVADLWDLMVGKPIAPETMSDGSVVQWPMQLICRNITVDYIDALTATITAHYELAGDS